MNNKKKSHDANWKMNTSNMKKYKATLQEDYIAIYRVDFLLDLVFRYGLRNFFS